MASDRRDRPAESHLQVDSLEDQAIQSKISILKDLVSSCRGPRGKAKVIQNSAGGHVTWTKLSSRLFKAMSFSTPVLKLVVSAVQGHLDRFQDGGLMTAEFCLSLVESSLKMNMHRKLVIELYERFAVIVDDYLNSDKCACKYEVDVFHLKPVMTVLRSVVCAKLSYLGIDIQEKLCALILDVFLSTIPGKPQEFFTDHVYVKCFENSDIYKSTCLKGVLLDCPELSSLKQQDLNLKTSTIDGGIQKIKVALVVESMSGDGNSFIDVNYELSESVDTYKMVVDGLQELCERCVKAEVGLLLCQRVIHPKIKIFLREHGVMFVDRIGSLPIPYIRDLTGALPLSIMSAGLEKSWSGFGWITGATHQIWSERSYLLLEHTDQPIVTLVLNHTLDEVLQDIKSLALGAVTSLQLLLKEPYVVAGGGCWMTHVGAHLLSMVEESRQQLVEDFDCSETQLRTITNNFVQCLQTLAAGVTLSPTHQLVDKEHYHIWADNSRIPDNTSVECRDTKSSSCNCGLLEKSDIDKFEYLSEHVNSSIGHIVHESCSDSVDGFPEVVDVLCVVRNALKMAVATGNTVLSISQYIHDSN